jgi:transcription elongation factor Elf1
MTRTISDEDGDLHADICPFCGFHDVEGEEVDIEESRATQTCSCLQCGQRWVNVYQLIAYRQIL